MTSRSRSRQSPSPSKTASPSRSPNRRARSSSPKAAPTILDKRIYVGNIPYECKDRDLLEHMEKIGQVKNAHVLVSRDGKAKGCGIVEFESNEDAQNAYNKYHNTSFMGRTMFLREDRMPERELIRERDAAADRERDSHRDRDRGRYRSRSRERNPQRPSANEHTLYVGNLPWKTSWQDLKDLFRDAGHVVRSDVPEYDDGRSKGFGTVSFESKQEAEKGIDLFDGYEYNGRKLAVRHDRYQSGKSDSHRSSRRRSRSRSYSRSRERRRKRSYSRDRSRSNERQRRPSTDRYRSRRADSIPPAAEIPFPENFQPQMMTPEQYQMMGYDMSQYMMANPYAYYGYYRNQLSSTNIENGANYMMPQLPEQ